MVTIEWYEFSVYAYGKRLTATIEEDDVNGAAAERPTGFSWAVPVLHLPRCSQRVCRVDLQRGGTVFLTLTWRLVNFGFGLDGRFGSYNATYGTLGGVVVLLIWFYLTAFLLLAGAEFGAVIAEKETGTKTPEGGQQTGAAR